MPVARRPKSELCLAIRHRPAAIDGVDICRKSKGHTASSDPRLREHFDPSSEERWTDEET